MMSGAMMSVISLRELVTSIVGIIPSVVPLLGSTAVSGTGSTGQVVGFSQLIFRRGFAAFGFTAGMGPVTFGAPGGIVAGGVAACGAACAARQSGAAAISPSAARARRLGLCFANVGTLLSLQAISLLSAAFGPRPRSKKEASMASIDDAGPPIISTSRGGPHACG